MAQALNNGEVSISNTVQKIENLLSLEALLQLVKEEDDLLAELKQRQQQKRQQKGNLAGATGISTTGAAGTS